MSAVVIGFGVAVAVLGVVLGGIGYGSARTPFSLALMTMGTTAFVGGLLLMALGFIWGALREIAQKLDGAVQFEPDEEEIPVGRSAVASRAIATEDFVPVSLDEEIRGVSPPAASAPVDERASGGGLPSWFRRKRGEEAEPDLPADVPAYEPAPSYPPEPDFEPLPPYRPAAEARAESVRPDLSRPDMSRPDLARPDLSRPEPPRMEPPRREPPPFLRPGAPASERPAPNLFEGEGFGSRAPEPRPSDLPAPRPRDPAEAEPLAPPAFLRESDLLGEPEEANEPEVTVLKSGTIGGMAYKLYSDGSIEADLPDGTLRFASLQDLREHVAGGGRPQG